MNISLSTVLQVDATIIAGLIILLTLQSLSSPFYQKEVGDATTQITNLALDDETTKNLIKEYCTPTTDTSNKLALNNQSELQQKCDQWKLESAELQSRFDAWRTIWSENHVFGNNGSIEPLKLASSGLFFTNTITIMMIFPFALSAVRVLSYKLKQKDENHTDALSIKLMMTGFIVLIFGLIVILLLIGCASPATESSFCPVT